MNRRANLVVTLGVLHFLISAAYSLYDISTTALLISLLGADFLPRAYLAGALSLLVVGLFVIPWIDRLDRVRLFSIVLVSLSLVTVLAGRLGADAATITYPLLYVLSFSVKSLLFLMFWLLAGDLVELRQAKRLFPALLGFSLAGGLIASISASVATRFVRTEDLLLVSAFILVTALIPLHLVGKVQLQQVPPGRSEPAGPSLSWFKRMKSDLDITKGSTMLRTLSVTLLLFALLSQIMDFLAASSADAYFVGDAQSLARFYALLNVAVIGIGALVQFLLARRLLSTIGITGGQLLAPVTLITALGAIWISTRLAGEASMVFFWTVVLARAGQKIVRISIFRSSTDLIYNTLPSDTRGRAKAFKETWIEPAGVVLGSAVLLLTRELTIETTLAIGLLLSGIFFWVSMQLKERYTESLLGILKERSGFRFAFPSLMMKAKPKNDASISILKQALTDKAKPVRLLAVDLAAELSEPAAARMLLDRFQEEPDEVIRARMFAALSRVYHARRSQIANPSEREPVARASGIMSLAELGFTDPSPEAVSRPEAREATQPQLTAEQESELTHCAESKDPSGPPKLIEYLEKGTGAMRHCAVRAVEHAGEAGIDMLTLALWAVDILPRRHVILALGRIDTDDSRQILHPALSLEGDQAHHELARLKSLLELKKTPALELLRISLAERATQARSNAQQILRLVFRRQSGMRLIVTNLDHPDAFVRSSAIEALEIQDDSPFIQSVLPLFEERDLLKAVQRGTAEIPGKTPFEVLVGLMSHPSSWIRALTLASVSEQTVPRSYDPSKLSRALSDRLADEDWLCRVNALDALARHELTDIRPHVDRMVENGEPLEIEQANVILARNL